MKWALVAFDHPDRRTSVLYRQNLAFTALLEMVQIAAEKGANLMSIRGFPEDPEVLE